MARPLPVRPNGEGRTPHSPLGSPRVTHHERLLLQRSGRASQEAVRSRRASPAQRMGSPSAQRCRRDSFLRRLGASSAKFGEAARIAGAAQPLFGGAGPKEVIPASQLEPEREPEAEAERPEPEEGAATSLAGMLSDFAPLTPRRVQARDAPPKLWGRIDSADVRILEQLGWSSASWDEGRGPPCDAWWEDLEEGQRRAAVSVGFDAQGWDELVREERGRAEAESAASAPEMAVQLQRSATDIDELLCGVVDDVMDASKAVARASQRQREGASLLAQLGGTVDLLWQGETARVAGAAQPLFGGAGPKEVIPASQLEPEREPEAEAERPEPEERAATSLAGMLSDFAPLTPRRVQARDAPPKLWGRIDSADVRILEQLGWSSASWDEGRGPPCDAWWEDLEEGQRRAAVSVGFDAQGWDELVREERGRAEAESAASAPEMAVQLQRSATDIDELLCGVVDDVMDASKAVARASQRQREGASLLAQLGGTVDLLWQGKCRELPIERAPAIASASLETPRKLTAEEPRADLSTTEGQPCPQQLGPAQAELEEQPPQPEPEPAPQRGPEPEAEAVVKAVPVLGEAEPAPRRHSLEAELGSALRVTPSQSPGSGLPGAELGCANRSGSPEMLGSENVGGAERIAGPASRKPEAEAQAELQAEAAVPEAQAAEPTPVVAFAAAPDSAPESTLAQEVETALEPTATEPHLALGGSGHADARSDTNMRAYFEYFDANSDGFLDMDETRQLIVSQGFEVGGDYMEKLFVQLSPQVPGKIDATEFTRLWKFIGEPAEPPGGTAAIDSEGSAATIAEHDSSHDQ
jgi:hypothetical protein